MHQSLFEVLGGSSHVDVREGGGEKWKSLFFYILTEKIRTIPFEF